MDWYIGIMSGTSMDGIDAVLVGFDKEGMVLKETYSDSFPADLKKDLEQLISAYTIGLQKLGEIDHRLGECYANCVNKLVEKSGIEAGQVKAVGCHGQTIFHSPDTQYPFTMQIGDGNIIAAKTGMTTVSDFRRMDMAFGGGGAPLAPAFHQGFLNSSEEKRGILNLGGISNITMLSEDEKKVVGFDIGPANCLMDSWIQQIKGLPFDENGDWARSGKIIPDLLEEMMMENYFSLAAPKSTGRELFNMEWLRNKLERFPNSKPEDVQATLLELTARSVAEAVLTVSPDRNAIYVCGGGAFNVYLKERMAAYLPGVKFGITDDLGVSVKWVEAIAFAWLAMRRIEKLPGNLMSVTGASEPALLGAIYESL